MVINILLYIDFSVTFLLLLLHTPFHLSLVFKPENNMKMSLVAQMIKNLPAIQETQVRSLDHEDPLKKKWQPTPVLLPGKFHVQRSLMGYSS